MSGQEITVDKHTGGQMNKIIREHF